MKKVIITVDTEGHRGNDPVERLIWGKTLDGKEFGINRIMDLCDEVCAKVLFFVDIAEAWDYGEEKVAQVIRHIISRGHDVGVHIHPDHMTDPNRSFLWEYSKDEQLEIIKKCTDLYKTITGKNPIAFRAGQYGANIDTLDILDQLGYKYDFSQFYGNKRCGINPPVSFMLPGKYKNVIEIPVTIFNSIKIGKFKRFDKIDAEMDRAEFKYVMDQIAIDNRPIITSLFYHSFSMLNWRKAPDRPTSNLKEEKKFKSALKFINESNNFKFIGLEELEQCNLNIGNDSLDEMISTKGIVRSFWYTIKRAYFMRSSNKKAWWLINGLRFILVIIICLLFYIYLF